MLHNDAWSVSRGASRKDAYLNAPSELRAAPPRGLPATPQHRLGAGSLAAAAAARRRKVLDKPGVLDVVCQDDFSFCEAGP
jgi:hypothetical protein